MPSHQSGDWRHLAEQASKEMETKKLLGLVNELNRVLGEREEQLRPKHPLDEGRPQTA